MKAKLANPNLKLENIHEDNQGIWAYNGGNLVELFTKDDEGDEGMIKAGYVMTQETIEQDSEMVNLWIRGDVYDTLTF